ncbi:MAG TPA: J domain-containing protein [Crocinitomix sp.]|nr:J domain-containing protein [Crocinitomix sp.]
MSNQFLTYYQLLDVETNATTTEILLAYKTKAKLYHPDKNKGHHTANKLFQLINQAKEVLTDPIKREEYDYSVGIKEKPLTEPEEEIIYTENNDTFNTKELITIGAIGLATGFILGQIFKRKKL